MKFETYQMPVASVQAKVKTKDGWLDPLFLAPPARHARSMIVLHGRGDNAYNFATMFLSLDLPNASMTLPEIFPDTKFIFPTSRLRRATSITRTKIAQWFDIYTLEDPDQRQELQHDGLHDSTMFVHDIIRQEAKVVGLENVVLGGLSQGCALGLHVLMSFDGESGQHLGGFFGMSGWLPFAKQLEALSQNNHQDLIDAGLGGAPGTDKNGDTDPFRNDISSSDADASAGARAIQFVRQHVMNFPHSKASNDLSSVPIFLGHGDLDEKVSMRLGEDAARIMAKLGSNVIWKPYSGLGHWYSLEELEDIAKFVQGLGCSSRKG